MSKLFLVELSLSDGTQATLKNAAKHMLVLQ